MADAKTESDEPTLDDVPDEYWDDLRERTNSITRHDIDDFENLEKLLSDRQFERLKNKIE